jgi:hypothetical protein
MLVEHTGNRGYHVWIFFKPVKAEYLVWIARKIAEKVGLRTYELFPKHTELNENIRFGDAVKLPFGIHRKTENRSELIYPSDIDEIVPLELPEEIQKKIQIELLKTETHSSLETPMKPIPWWTRCKVYEIIRRYGVPEGYRDESAFLLARIFRDQGLLEEEAFEKLKQWNEKNSPPLDTKTLRMKIKQAYSKKYAVGFRSIIKNNVLKIFCPADCNECKYSPAKSENENSKISLEYIEGKTGKYYLVGGELLAKRYLVEIVEIDGIPKPLIWDVEANEYNVYDTFELEGVTYQPYPNLPFEYLPSMPRKVDEDPELWYDTYQFIYQYYDNPRNENVYHVLTAGVAWSYFCFDIKVSTPYIGFLGPYRTGKGRGLEAMGSLCYRALQVIDPSEASTFRLIEELKPTLIIDEAQILDKTIQAILDAGYRYGAKLPRVIDPEKEGLDGMRWYDVFGFKIYASREEPPPNTLSRTIPIKCEKNIRQTLKILPKDKAQELRTRWLAQRLRLFNKVSVTFEEFRSSDGRLQELFSPLLIMARLFGDSEAVKAVEEYGREVEQEILDMESTSDDAIILEALVELLNSASNDAPEYVTVKEITKKLNDGFDKPVYDPRYVGRRLSILGFRKKRLRGGQRAYLIDYSLLERLATRYNITSISKDDSEKNLYMG